MSIFDDPNDPQNIPLAQSQSMGPGPGLLSAENLAGAPQPPAGLLAPGGNAPAPAQSDNSNILDRVIARLKGGLTGDAPSGYSGVLSPDDIKKAQPGFFRSLISPDAHKEFMDNLNQAVSASQLPAAVAMQKQHLAVQQQIAQQFPPAPNETLEGTRDRLLQMYTYGAAHGADPAWLKDLGEVASKVATVARPVRSPVQVNDVISDGSINPAFKGQTVVQLRDPDTNRVIAEMPKGAPPMSEDAKNFRVIQQAMTAQGQSDANERAAATRSESEANHFAIEAKPFTDSQSAWLSFHNAAAEAALGNPAAYKSVILNYMQNESSKNPQARIAILNYLGQLDPSIQGNMAIALQKIQSGTFPPAVLQNVEKLVDSKHQMMANQYDALRSAKVKNNPRLQNIIPETSTVFGMPPNVDIPGVVNPGKAPALKVQKYLPGQ